LPSFVLDSFVFRHLIQNGSNSIRIGLRSCKKESFKLINQILGAVKIHFCILSLLIIFEQLLINNQLNDSFGLQLSVTGVLLQAAFGLKL